MGLPDLQPARPPSLRRCVKRKQQQSIDCCSICIYEVYGIYTHGVLYTSMSAVDDALVGIRDEEDGYQIQQYLQTLSENASSVMKYSGALDSIISCIKRNKTDTSVVSQAFMVLHEIASVRSSNRIAIAAGGGMQMILIMLNAHMKDREIAEEGCAALKAIVVCKETRLLFSKAGGIDILFQTMQYHWAVKDVIEHGCYISWGLAFDEAHHQYLINGGCVDILIKAIEDWDKFAHIVEFSCGALRNLATSSIRYQVEIINSGGILTPIMALQHHSTNPKVAEQALALLATFANANNQSANQLKSLAVPYVIPTIKMIKFTSTAMEQGCHMLWCISAVSAHELVDAGVIDLLTHALETHQHSAEVVRKVCGTIANLAAVEYCRSYMSLVTELLELMLLSLETHIDRPEVIVQVIRALNNLALEDYVKGEIGRLKAIGWIVDGLRTHASNPNVVKQTCVLIGRLAFRPENEDYFVRSHATKLLMEVVQIYHAESHIIEVALIALRNLASNEEMLLSLQTAEVMDIVVALLQSHCYQPGICINASVLLRYIALENECRRYLQSTGVVSCCRQVLELFDEESIVALEARALLEDL